MSYHDHVLMFADRKEALGVLTALGHAHDGEFSGYCIAPLSITVPTG